MAFQESLIPKVGAAPDRIRHARNGGEQRIPVAHDSPFVDGYDPVTNTVYEFHGCLWHGCRTCFPTRRDIKSNFNADRTLNEVHLATLIKSNALRREGYTLEELWECEWKQAVADPTSPAHQFVSTLTWADPLVPRDAFFGGRTGAVSLYATADASRGETIQYLDVTSLYSWVNKIKRYPVGHPEIITHPPHLDIERYFGIAVVDILPPPHLFHPVLPVRKGGKLTFPLCGACVDEQQALPLLERTSVCAHSDAQRTLRGTWCTPEIEMALEKGYRLIAIHEVWNFPPNQQRTGLFADYVNTWLKIKQESAGWPAWCTTEEQRDSYLAQYHEQETITLDRDLVASNPGRKATAKLMLNSFWGKFGERENKPTTQVVTSPAALYRLLRNPLLEVSNLRLCTDDILEAVYTSRAEDVRPSVKTNIFVAAFTTCWARLKLFSYLDTLGERVPYYDTDSVIFKQAPGQPSIPTGDFLGDMTNELSHGDHIVEFVSGGAKNYGYKTHRGQTCCKVRGFTLNLRGQEVLNYQSLRNHILQELENPQEESRTLPVVKPHHFKRDTRTKSIGLVRQVKNYSLVFDKRVIDPETYSNYPYGYTRVDSDVNSLLDLLDL